MIFAISQIIQSLVLNIKINSFTDVIRGHNLHPYIVCVSSEGGSLLCKCTDVHALLSLGCMRTKFPTMWHFDKCRLRLACSASY